MKLLFFILLSLLCFHVSVFSQDMITLKSGEDIKCKVTEVGISEIAYMKFDNPEGPVYKISKSDVLLIVYANGSKDVFAKTEMLVAKEEHAQAEHKSVNTVSPEKQGRKDASRYYRGYKKGQAATLATTIVAGPFGTIPAAVSASRLPDEASLDFPNSPLANDPQYRYGYTDKAKKMKKIRSWASFGIGMGIHVSVAAAVVPAIVIISNR